MKIKINEQLKDSFDAPLKSDNKIITFKDIAIHSILAPVQGDDEKKKWDKYEIYSKLKEATSEVELKAEQISILKAAIGKIQPPLVMGQCWEIIERTSTK